MEIIIIIALAAGAMFLLTNRSRKQQKSAQDLLASLAPGQEIMTRGGMFGTVVDVDQDKDIVTIESTPGTQTRWLRAAIAKVIEPETSEDAPEDGDAASIASGSSADADESAIDFQVPDDLSGLSQPGVDLDKDSTPRREDGDEDTK